MFLFPQGSSPLGVCLLSGLISQGTSPLRVHLLRGSSPLKVHLLLEFVSFGGMSIRKHLLGVCPLRVLLLLEYVSFQGMSPLGVHLLSGYIFSWGSYLFRVHLSGYISSQGISSLGFVSSQGMSLLGVHLFLGFVSSRVYLSEYISLGISLLCCSPSKDVSCCSLLLLSLLLPVSPSHLPQLELLDLGFGG